MDTTRKFVSSQYPHDRPLKGPLIVVAHFCIPALPTAKQSLRDSMHQNAHWKRPDIDNFTKFVFDSVNTVVWEDDSQIAWYLASKSYTSDKKGYTLLYAAEVLDGKPNYKQIIDELAENIVRP